MLHRPMDRQCPLDRRSPAARNAPAASARSHIAAIITLSAAALLLPLTSCGPTVEASFDSPEPAARNSAIVRAGAGLDADAVPDLVRMLESDDPATRMLAIEALDRITGKRLGFEPHAEQVEREESIDRWRSFVNDFRPRSVMDHQMANPVAASTGGIR